MTQIELFNQLHKGIEDLRSDFREDVKALRDDMGERFDQNADQVRSLNDKVAIQNGRVRTLEEQKKRTESWAAIMMRQPWFPWVAVFAITAMGGEAAGRIVGEAMKFIRGTPAIEKSIKAPSQSLGPNLNQQP